MVSRQIDTTEMISRLGGELKGTSSGFETRNTQPAFRAPSLGSTQSKLEDFNFRSVDSKKFEMAVSFFTKKGVPRSIARTYGATLLETSARTGKDITELVRVTKNNKIRFEDDSLTQINIFRPKTSQIGYRVEGGERVVNEFIDRAIVP